MRLGSIFGDRTIRCAAAALLLFPGLASAANSMTAAAAVELAQAATPSSPDQPSPAAPAAPAAAPAPAPAPEQPSAAPQAAQPQPQKPKPSASQQVLPGTVKSTHGAWSIVCDKPNSTEKDQCGLIQNVVAEDRPEMGLSIIVIATPDHRKILRVRAPLNILIPNGLGLNIDGKDIGRVNFTRCFADGCYAEAVLEDTLVKAFRDGKIATFILFQTPEEGIGIPVDLNGFADGYDALQ